MRRIKLARWGMFAVVAVTIIMANLTFTHFIAFLSVWLVGVFDGITMRDNGDGLAQWLVAEGGA